MTEEEVKSSTLQEVATPVTNSESAVQNENSQVNQGQDKGLQELNFKKLRERTEKAEKTNFELQNQFNELKQRLEGKPTSQDVEEDLSKLDPEDILTVEQSDKRSEKIAKKIVKEVLQQKEKELQPLRTKGRFKDFDEIMTKENIQKFEQMEPGLAQACSKAPNPWEATYKMLKKFVLPQEEAKISKSADKVNENLSAPISSNSVGRSGPLNNANAWSQASKEDLYKEMKRYAQG